MNTTFAIVVLGSPNNEKGEISQIWLSRLEVSLNLFNKLNSENCRMLLTGGFGEHFNKTKIPHAEYAKKWLITNGISEGKFLEQALSSNTYDDGKRSTMLDLFVAKLLKCSQYY
jgi:hypothetical protein